MPPAALGVHSYYSLGKGVSSPRALVEEAARLGYSSVALVDDRSTAGCLELCRAARAVGVDPVIGATLEVRLGERRTQARILAASERGLAHLNALLTRILAAPSQGVHPQELADFAEDLFCLLEPPVFQPAEVGSVLDSLGAIYRERFFLAVPALGLPGALSRAREWQTLAKERGYPVVASLEVRYARPELAPLYEALLCARLGIPLEAPHPDRPQTLLHLPGPAERELRLPFPRALANAAALCREVALRAPPRGDWRLARPVLDPERTALQTLRRRAQQALEERYRGAEREEALARLERELSEIARQGWAEGFLCAAEIADYARSRGYLAAARGSAAASLVGYLLGLGQVDPLRHGLLFERFLHPGQTHPPDIDLDLESAGREEVIAWALARWPESAFVAEWITYRLPLAVDDLGRALGLRAEQRQALKEQIPPGFRRVHPHQAPHLPGLREALPWPLVELLGAMEPGHPRHYAPHPGGLILSDQPLHPFAPQVSLQSGRRLLLLDKEACEELGLGKVDLLGLRILSAFSRARREVLRLEGRVLDLAHLRVAHEDWDSLAQGETLGLFQIESPAQAALSRRFAPRDLGELALQEALLRPGPLASGAFDELLKRRAGAAPIRYPHPAAEAILAHTYGVLVYQEDLLRLAHDLAGYSWAEASRLRKLLARAEEDLPAEERRRFLEGVRRTLGASPEEAEGVLALLEQGRGYTFAHSHALAFARHTLVSLGLRREYPAEYLAALLTEEPGMWSRSTIRHAASRWGKGVKLLPLDINRSYPEFRVERDPRGDKAVRVGLLAVRGLGRRLAEELVFERESGGAYASLEDCYRRVRLERKAALALADGGAFDAFASRREARFLLETLFAQEPPGARRLLNPTPPAPPPFPPLSPQERWELERLATGLPEEHPMDLLRSWMESLGAAPLGALRNRSGRVRTAGWVVARRVPPRGEGEWIVVLEDRADHLTVRVPGSTAGRAGLALGQALAVEGWLSPRGLRAERVAAWRG